jgi:short-subunit dehydrogenase
MDDNKVGCGRTALITGASSGIGEALAHCFARGGFDLVLVARSAEKLEALAIQMASSYGIKARAWPVDLSRDGSARKLRLAMQRGKHAIDVLVNNAGVIEHGRFVAMPARRHQQLIDLNVSSLTAMLAEFLPPMLERGQGRILNVASIAAFQPVPSLATYAATKAYVLSLTESLSEELQGTGVSITALCPGITATSMLSGVKASSSQVANLPGFLISSVDDVAEQAYAACIQGEVVKVPGTINQVALLASRAAPKWLVRRIGGVLGRRSI